MNRTLMAAVAGVLLALAIFATGQMVGPAQSADQNPDMGKPVIETSCSQAAVGALRAAVDPEQAEKQDWNLKAAQAYRELAELGQSC